MDLSVVIPCYNEEDCLPELYRRVKAACESAPLRSYEIILVNDGSTDQTFFVLQGILESEPNAVVVDLSRNHGQSLALSAGLSQARGDYIFILDADLQDPPELLAPMLEIARSGVDVVYGRRIERRGENWFKLACANLFYKTLSYLADTPIPENVSDFRLMSRRVLDHLMIMPEHHRFIRGMISWIGFRQEAFPFERDARFAGVTKYPFSKQIRIALDAICSFSIKPLRISILFAAFGAIIAGFLALYVILGYLFFSTMSGWTSLACIIIFFSSLQLICIGVIGEYLGRIYIESKHRPLFIIRSVQRGPDKK